MSGRARGLAGWLVMWMRLTWTWSFYDFPSDYIAAALRSVPSSRLSSPAPPGLGTARHGSTRRGRGLLNAWQQWNGGVNEDMGLAGTVAPRDVDNNAPPPPLLFLLGGGIALASLRSFGGLRTEMGGTSVVRRQRGGESRHTTRNKQAGDELIA